VTFVDKNNQNDVGFTLTLSQRTEYDQMVIFFLKIIKVLFSNNLYTGYLISNIFILQILFVGKSCRQVFGIGTHLFAILQNTKLPRSPRTRTKVMHITFLHFCERLFPCPTVFHRGRQPKSFKAVQHYFSASF
jgi:hypothetical protein